MEYTDLTPDEQLLLVGLLEMVGAADQVLSDEERAYLQDVANKLGQAQFDAMVNAARQRLRTPDDLKGCALSIQRHEARELILASLQDLAVSDEVTIEEMQIVNWLADLWDL